MPSERLPLYLFVGFGLFSLFYQTIGRNLWVQVGYGYTLQPLSDFPYTCRRLNDPSLEACEDMWLSEGTRQLFLACSDSVARKEWLPKCVDISMCPMLNLVADKPQSRPS